MVSATNEVKRGFFRTFGSDKKYLKKDMNEMFEKFSHMMEDDLILTFKKYLILLNIVKEPEGEENIAFNWRFADTFYDKNDHEHIEIICQFAARKYNWMVLINCEPMTDGMTSDGEYLEMSNIMKYGYDLSNSEICV